MRFLTDVSLLELTNIVSSIEEDERSALQLFAKPRTFFRNHGICIPMDAAISIVHREELRAILHTPGRFLQFRKEAEELEDSVTIHVTRPVAAYCGKITIKCPKKNQSQSAELSDRIISEVSISEVLSLIHTVEQSDTSPDDISQLSKHPTRFFNQRGLVVPSDVRLEIIDTNEMLAQLDTERGIDSFLDSEEREPLVAALAHVTGGAMHCKKIKYNCVKD
ncbi:MAG: hypothetical protein AB8B64_05205 [Granulosicoccus sp.]